MRILEIIPTLGSGGAERFVVDLSNELCEKDNVEVMLLTLYDISESDIFASFLSKRVRLYSLGKKLVLVSQHIFEYSNWYVKFIQI